jgi:hypothetical protein
MTVPFNSGKKTANERNDSSTIFFGMMLNNTAFAAFWLVLIRRTGGVGGYGFSDVMLVWAFVSSSTRPGARALRQHTATRQHHHGR